MGNLARSTSADLAKEVYSCCHFGNVYLKGCLWIGFKTSLLVSSGFGVPFASRLICFLYVAEFNFRVPLPCWFAMAAFRWKVWASETNGNINIHFIFRSTAINQPKLHNKLKDPQQHVFKSVLTTSHEGGAGWWCGQHSAVEAGGRCLSPHNVRWGNSTNCLY